MAMGELGGFLKIVRVNGPKRPVGERVYDFREYQESLPVPELHQQAVDLDGRGNVAAHDYATSVPGVLAAGDARRGHALNVWAINEGRKAARTADAYLSELGQEPGDDPIGALLSA